MKRRKLDKIILGRRWTKKKKGRGCWRVRLHCDCKKCEETFWRREKQVSKALENGQIGFYFNKSHVFRDDRIRQAFLKNSATSKGRKFSSETKRKISESAKGRPAWNKGLYAVNTGRMKNFYAFKINFEGCSIFLDSIKIGGTNKPNANHRIAVIKNELERKIKSVTGIDVIIRIKLLCFIENRGKLELIYHKRFKKYHRGDGLFDAYLERRLMASIRLIKG